MRKALEDLVKPITHLLPSLLRGYGLGREVDKDVAVPRRLLTESLQRLLSQLLLQLFGLLALGRRWCAVQTWRLEEASKGIKHEEAEQWATYSAIARYYDAVARSFRVFHTPSKTL